MKYYGLYFQMVLLLMLALPGSAQRLPLIYEDLAVIPIEIADEGGAFIIDWNPDEVRSLMGEVPVYQIDSLFFDGSNLGLRILPLGQSDKPFHYHANLFLDDRLGKIRIGSPKDLRGTGNFGITWEEFAEKSLLPDEPMDLVLKLEIRGDVCSSEPELGLRQGAPFLGGGLLGMGMLAVGQVYRLQVERDYANYQADWRTEESGDFDPIDENRRTYRTLTIAGWAVLVADATWYLLGPRKKYRKDRKDYDLFCKERTRLELEPRILDLANYGFTVKLNF